MRYITFLLVFLGITTYSQSEIDLNGVYLDSRDTFHFYQDSVSFHIMSNGGLIFPLEGHGSFAISKNILTIKTEKTKHDKNKSQEPRKLGDKVFIEEKTLVFLINEYSKENLNLTLLGIIENSKFHKKKTTRKFLREHKKFKYRERELNKN